MTMEIAVDNKKTLSSFIKTEYDKLIGYVKKYLQDSSDINAEDIVQEVALNIYDKIDINTRIENVAAYFFGALRNKIIDIYRKPKKKVNIDDDTFDFLDSKENDISHQYEVEQMESYQILYDAIDKLNPDQKEILVATEFDKKSFEELSKEWNVPIGTLLSRKHRAINNLQKLLDDFDYYDF